MYSLWNNIGSHIRLSEIQDSPTFTCDNANKATTQKDIIRASTDLAFKIASHAQDRLSLVPQHDATAEELAAAGIVDGALFPPDLVASCVPSLDTADVQHFEDWPLQCRAHNIVAFILHALTHPEDPYAHISVLDFLAQRTGGAFLSLLLVPAVKGESIRQRLQDSYRTPYDMVFSTTNGYGDLYWRRGVIGRYIDLTMRYYLFLNLLIATDSNRAVLQSGAAQSMDTFPGSDGLCGFTNPGEALDEESLTQSTSTDEQWWLERGGYMDLFADGADTSSPFVWFPKGDALHTPFWGNGNEKVAERTQVYLDRCFDVIVAWYALMRTASDEMNNTTFDDVSSPEFGFDDLVGIILVAFESFGEPCALPPFKFPLERFLTNYIDDFAYPQTSNPLPPVTITPLNWTVHFLDLPIVSLVPLTSLVSLSQVCKRMRSLCIDKLFADPFSRLRDVLRRRQSFFHSRQIEALEMRTRKLRMVLESSQVLRDAVQKAVFHAGVQRPKYDSDRLDREGLEFFSPLASQLPNLQNLELILQSTQSWTPEGANTMYPLLQVAQSRWPKLRSINVVYHQVEGKYWNKFDEAQRAGALHRCLADAASLTWGLESIVLERFLVAGHGFHYDVEDGDDDDDREDIDEGEDDEGGEDDHVPFAPLISSSVDTLRFLSMNMCKKDIGDISAFPQCPNVTKLILASNLDPPAVETLLSRFPVLQDLKLSRVNWDLYDEWHLSSPSIDFAVVTPRLEQLWVAHFGITALPVLCTKLCQVLETDPEFPADGPLPLPLVTSKFVEVLALAGYRKSLLLPHLSSLGQVYPSVVSLDIQPLYSYNFDDDSEELADTVLRNFHQLETLIIPEGLETPHRWGFNFPEGEDNEGEDDEGEDDEVVDVEEKRAQMVLGLFKKSKILKVVVLRRSWSNRDDPISKKVWIRCANGEVCMAGTDTMIPVGMFEDI